MLRQAQHERGKGLQRLQCHQATPARTISAVEARVLADRGSLTFTVTGADALMVPERRPAERANGLWRATCFELFWRARDAEQYVELNLSPSGQWAAYHFDSRRSGMREHPMAVGPVIATHREGDRFHLAATLDPCTLPSGPALAGLSAVIEEVGGPTSYWALAHPADWPDFHDPSCFLLTLPAPG